MTAFPGQERVSRRPSWYIRLIAQTEVFSDFSTLLALEIHIMPRRIILALLLLALASTTQAFTLTDSRGKTHRLADYKGKWVLVNFWATWCPPCLEEIPDLVALHENKQNRLVVIGIAMDYRDPKQVIEFAEQQMISYPIVLGNSKSSAEIGPVRGLPTTYLYNPEGKVVAYNVGALSRATVEAYIVDKKSKSVKH
jgi:thiol-disulfide isomerase/thioredoxin